MNFGKHSLSCPESGALWLHILLDPPFDHGWSYAAKHRKCESGQTIATAMLFRTIDQTVSPQWPWSSDFYEISGLAVLFLFSYSFEWFVVGFLIHKATCFRVTLGPAAVVRVICLWAIANCAVTMSVAFGRVCCHNHNSLNNRHIEIINWHNVTWWLKYSLQINVNIYSL